MVDRGSTAIMPHDDTLGQVARTASVNDAVAHTERGPTSARYPVIRYEGTLSRYVRRREAVDFRQRRFVAPCGMLLFSLDHTTQYAQRRARPWTVVTISALKRQP